MNRRRYLKLLGSVTGASGLAGCGSRDRTTPEPTSGPPPSPESPTRSQIPSPTTTTSTPELPEKLHDIAFDRVIHAVGDLGMDPSGNEPIDQALDKAYSDGTLIAFPPGKYLATKEHMWEEGANGFGLLGLGKSHRDVQFVFPPGNRQAEDPANYRFLHVKSGRDHVLQNVTIQQSRDKKTGVGMVFYQKDGLHVQDVELAGFNPSWEHDPGFGIIAAITDRAGVGVIRRFTCTGGGVISEYPKRKTPIGSFENHRGELRILEPHIEESGSHSMYISRTNGCVRVEDGLFRNNDNTNLRMSGGGHPDKRSWAKNCRIVIDIDSAKHLPEGEAYQGCRGFWIESGGEHQYGHTDLLVENLAFTARSNANPLPLVLVDHSHGSVTMRGCKLATSVEGMLPFLARDPNSSFVSKPYRLLLENVEVDTTATHLPTGAAMSIDGRPNSRLRDLSVVISLGSVDGIHVRNSDDVHVLGTSIVARPAEDLPTPELASSEVAGKNTGIVVENSKNFHMKNSNFDVPGQRVLKSQEEVN